MQNHAASVMTTVATQQQNATTDAAAIATAIRPPQSRRKDCGSVSKRCIVPIPHLPRGQCLAMKHDAVLLHGAPDRTAGNLRTLKKNFHSRVMRALGQVTPVSAAFSSARVANQVSSLAKGRAQVGRLQNQNVAGSYAKAARTVNAKQTMPHLPHVHQPHTRHALATIDVSRCMWQATGQRNHLSLKVLPGVSSKRCSSSTAFSYRPPVGPMAECAGVRAPFRPEGLPLLLLVSGPAGASWRVLSVLLSPSIPVLLTL